MKYGHSKEMGYQKTRVWLTACTGGGGGEGILRGISGGLGEQFFTDNVRAQGYKVGWGLPRCQVKRLTFYKLHVASLRKPSVVGSAKVKCRGVVGPNIGAFLSKIRSYLVCLECWGTGGEASGGGEKMSLRM